MSHLEVTIFLPLGPNAAWKPALVLPFAFFDVALGRLGFSNIAFVRYLCASLLGVKDGVVFQDSAARPEDLADPSNPLAAGQKLYFTHLLDEQGDLAKLAESNPLPIHPKDATTSCPRESKSKTRPTLEPNVLRLLGLRDRGLCQFDQRKPTEKIPKACGVYNAHIIPWRRGDPTFWQISHSRGRERAPVDGSMHVHALDEVRNLVSLDPRIHSMWDNHAIMFLPLPNVALDSRGHPSPYHQQGTTNMSVPTQQPPPAPTFEHPGMPWSREENHDVPRASLACPVVVAVEYKDKLYLKGRNRMRGPEWGREDEWPPEWLWSYRFASQVAAHFATTDFAEFLLTTWKPFIDLDPRGDADASTSTSGSGLGDLIIPSTPPPQDGGRRTLNPDSTPRSNPSVSSHSSKRRRQKATSARDLHEANNMHGGLQRASHARISEWRAVVTAAALESSVASPDAEAAEMPDQNSESPPSASTPSSSELLEVVPSTIAPHYHRSSSAGPVMGNVGRSYCGQAWPNHSEGQALSPEGGRQGIH